MATLTAQATGERPVILVIIEYYLPGYRGGGTIRSLANLVENLGERFEFRIVTRNHDWRCCEVYEGIPPHEWVPVGKAQVMYLPATSWTFLRLRQVLMSIDYDLLYLSSAFSFSATIQPLVLRWMGLLTPRPVILGPRGEFSPGALAIRAAKKRIYLCVARCFGLFRRVYWQASTCLEREDIRRQIGSRAAIVGAIDCSPKYDEWSVDSRRDAKIAGRARVCFVSRITPKKNLETAISILSKVDGFVEFDIYGPVDDLSYWSRCEAALRDLPANVVAIYRGARNHEELRSIFAASDLFLFPTRGENFGHVILESLAAGCPVLLSDQTPWRDLKSAGVGWDVPLDDHALFVRAMQEVIDMSEASHALVRGQCRAFALRAADPSRAIRENEEMFRGVLEDSASRE